MREAVYAGPVTRYAVTAGDGTALTAVEQNTESLLRGPRLAVGQAVLAAWPAEAECALDET